jgi:hypothetical protein
LAPKLVQDLNIQLIQKRQLAVHRKFSRMLEKQSIFPNGASFQLSGFKVCDEPVARFVCGYFLPLPRALTVSCAKPSMTSNDFH